MTATEGDAVRRQLADELVSVTERLREAEAQLDTARTIISQHVQKQRAVATLAYEALRDGSDLRYIVETVLGIVQRIDEES